MKKTIILLATALTVTLVFNASSILISDVTASIISYSEGTSSNERSATNKANKSNESNESSDEYSGLATYNESATIER